MESLTVHAKSWHYQLATRYADACDYEIEDICSYSRAVIKGIIIACIITWICGALLGTLSCFFVWIAVGLITGWCQLPELATYGAGIFLLIILIGTLIIWDKTRRNQKPKDKDTPPGFVVQAYRSFKDKYCIKVLIE